MHVLVQIQHNKIYIMKFNLQCKLFIMVITCVSLHMDKQVVEKHLQ